MNAMQVRCDTATRGMELIIRLTMKICAIDRYLQPGKIHTIMIPMGIALP